MYNRYRGNGGKPEKMPDAYERPVKKPLPTPLPPARGRLLPKDFGKALTELETEDILLILILYLMYRESGDKDLLIIMGAMYLL